MKISIIVPIYNVKEYLEKCVESLINQTYKKIEIILVNDGSTDDSGKIVDYYSKKYDFIKGYHKKNGGLSDARNYGLKHATGEYVIYVDSDDYISPDTIEELVKIINTRNADIVCFNLQSVDNKGNIIKKNTYCEKDTGEIIEFNYQSAIIDNIYRKHIRYSASSKIIKREIANEVLFPFQTLAEDFATFYKFLKKANKIVYVDRNFYYYLQREGSIMHKKVNDKLYIDLYNTEIVFYKEVEECVINEKDILKNNGRHLKVLLKCFSKLKHFNQKHYLLKDIKNEINSIKKIGFTDKVIKLLFNLNNCLFSKIYCILK